MKVRRQWSTASTGSWDTIIIIWFIWEWKKPQQAREPLPPNNWCKPQQSLTWRAPVAFHQSLFSHDSQKTPLRTIVMSGYFSAQNPLAVPNSPLTSGRFPSAGNELCHWYAWLCGFARPRVFAWLLSITEASLACYICIKSQSCRSLYLPHLLVFHICSSFSSLLCTYFKFDFLWCLGMEPWASGMWASA